MSNQKQAAWLARLLIVAVLTINCSHCILINRGVRDAQTLLVAGVGVLMLYAALRLVFARLSQKPQGPAWLRVLIGLVLGAAILLA